MNRVLRFVVALALLMIASSGIGKAAAGDVVLMPDRDALTGTAIVVWGNTAPGHAGQGYTIDFGDGSANAVGTVTDPSYVAVNHTYAGAGTFTVTMTVNGDSDTATVKAFVGASLSAENLRNVGINMAIENGLRYLYFSQDNRQATYTAASKFTSWTAIANGNGAFSLSYSSLVVLALENHGHTVADDPTQDIFQRVVQRGLNYIFDNLTQIPLGLQNGNNPCVGVPADANVCVGLGWTSGDSMYVSSVLALAIAGSGAPGTLVGPGIGAGNGNFVVGRTYAEIIQRQANTIMWGMGDSGNVRGGFGYDHNDQSGDGSAAGWGVLALLDTEAAGATMPAWVRADVLNYATTGGLNTDGSLKYQVYYGDNQSNFPKTGIALEVMSFSNKPAGDPKVVGAEGLLSTNWASGYTTDGFDGHNKGHAYGMFNAFKGLKLYGVQTLPGVGRPAGPGAIPANDWHADYQDYLVGSQVNANTTSGGQWNFQFGWSYCGTCNLGGGPVAFTAIAELILSPTALVLPANLTLSPLTATNTLPADNTHTVTAVATSASGSFIPGSTVTFNVIAGPNTGLTGTDTTDAAGEATFTYTSNGTSGVDTIRANIGGLVSNNVSKTWVAPKQGLVCDVDGDNDVDLADINAINAARNTVAGPNDPRDANGDGVINVVDSRFCAVRRTAN